MPIVGNLLEMGLTTEVSSMEQYGRSYIYSMVWSTAANYCYWIGRNETNICEK